jgi:hypothetical protein
MGNISKEVKKIGRGCERRAGGRLAFVLQCAASAGLATSCIEPGAGPRSSYRDHASPEGLRGICVLSIPVVPRGGHAPVDFRRRPNFPINLIRDTQINVRSRGAVDFVPSRPDIRWFKA